MLCLALWLGSLMGSSAADSLAWNKDKKRVDADIQSWPLEKLLQRVAASTGWQIFIEPGTTHTVSAKFKDLPPGDALQKLLGSEVNFALLPHSNAAPKLTVFRTTPDSATQLIRPAANTDTNGNAISNELVVRLKAGSGVNIDDLAKQLGAKVVGRIDGMNAYRLKFDDEEDADTAREKLKKNSAVDEVESNYFVDRPPPAEALTLSSPLPFSVRPKVVGDADRLIVGLVDTAVQKGFSKVDEFLLPATSVAGDAKPPSGSPTHGTSMAAAILRGLDMLTDDPKGTPVRILSVDVYGGRASTTTFDVAYGIDEAIKRGATIINLSMGSEGDSSLLHTIIMNSQKQGVLFFGAAGNEPTTTPTFPAAYPEVVAVTAGDRQGHIASWANYGNFVDIIAPGAVVFPFWNQNYLSIGTSASTAYASGMAAAIAGSKKVPLSQVEAEIRRLLTLKTAVRP